MRYLYWYKTKSMARLDSLVLLGVVKYVLSLFSEALRSCMSSRVLSPSLRSKLFPEPSLSPNECTH